MNLFNRLDKALNAWYDKHVLLVFHCGLVLVGIMLVIQAIREIGGK